MSILKNKHFQVIQRPLVTEKSNRVAEKHKQFVFAVSKTSTKKDIALAISELFKVKVKSVQTLNMRGKARSFKGVAGRTQNWKKAYVALEPGYDINFAELNFE